MVRYIILFLLLGFIAFSCDDQEEPFDVPLPDLVAMIAVFDNLDENGVYPEKLVLVDYYDPANYKIVTDKPIRAREPIFSRDKTKILFGDRSRLVHGFQFGLYDIQDETMQLLEAPTIGENVPLSGFIAVWNVDDSGFYFSQPPPPFSMARNVLFYQFSDQSVEMVHNGKGYAVYPRALKGGDTLIVFSNNVAETGQIRGFYFMDLEGNYFSIIDNPYLELINIGGVNKKAAYNPSWNDELGLFVYAEIDSTVRGYKISVTNLDGSYYRAYTSGSQYSDDNPTWGPEGKTILFNRREIGDHSFTGYNVMKIDRVSGEVEEYVNPDKINGAIALKYPDY